MITVRIVRRLSQVIVIVEYNDIKYLVPVRWLVEDNGDTAIIHYENLIVCTQYR